MVYGIRDRPDLVLILLKRNRKGDTLSKERAFLDELAAKGVPVARILEVGTWGDYFAGIQQRYEVSDRDVMAYAERHWDLLNESSLADADKIWNALTAAKLDVKDPQFLVAKDGHIVLNDPLGLEPMPEKEEDRKTFGLLRALRMDAREAIDTRKLFEHVKAIPGADDRLLAPYFAKRTVDYIPFGDDKKAGQVKEALLHYLETGPSTEEARRVAKAIRAGKLPLSLVPGAEDPGVFRVYGGESFFVMATELVSQGSALLDPSKGLEASVRSSAQGLAFLEAKQVPDGVGRSAVYARGSELREDPSKFLESLLEKGRTLDPTERSHLEALASGILSRARAVSSTPGLTGLIERSMEHAGVDER